MTDCTRCHRLRRRLFLFAATFLPFTAHAKPPLGTDLNSPTSKWFARQHNLNGGWCCDLSDGHVLDAVGHVRMNDAGNYEVLLGEGAEAKWCEVVPYKMRDPVGGTNPIGHPIVWYNTYSLNGETDYSIYCFDPDIES